MINRDPKCVFVANTLGEAEVVVAWLGGEAITAQVMDNNTLVDPVLLEVWVKDSGDIDRANALIAARHAELEARSSPQAESLGPVDVACDECGKTTRFEENQRGTVQNCKDCGAHVDVPGDDEDWSDAEAAADAEGDAGAV